mmetsp:Transcript_13016/g.30819  ORF Transcript_13016/g.30819 Transcript_13016/m.30819 type:complete len:173 (-) Transcript_13016:292-810(-)
MMNNNNKMKAFFRSGMSTISVLAIVISARQHQIRCLFLRLTKSRRHGEEFSVSSEACQLIRLGRVRYVLLNNMTNPSHIGAASSLIGTSYIGLQFDHLVLHSGIAGTLIVAALLYMLDSSLDSIWFCSFWGIDQMGFSRKSATDPDRNLHLHLLYFDCSSNFGRSIRFRHLA